MSKREKYMQEIKSEVILEAKSHEVPANTIPKKEARPLEETPALKVVKDPNPNELSDPALILKLAYRTERLNNIVLNKELKTKVYKERLVKIKTATKRFKKKYARVKAERNVTIQELDHEALRAASAVESVRKVIERKYGIDLAQYTYDGETGVLKRIPASQSRPGKTDND